jgi:hypothetical protein
MGEARVTRPAIGALLFAVCVFVVWMWGEPPSEG